MTVAVTLVAGRVTATYGRGKDEGHGDRSAVSRSGAQQFLTNIVFALLTTALRMES
jgi:hypothetical protein